MKRYWIPEEWVTGDSIGLSGEIYHHIHNVCRNEVGSKFELLSGKNLAYFVELAEAGKKSGVARIIETRAIASLPAPHIHLAVSIPRFQKLDFIIEKAVELGVAAVHPFVSDYSFVRRVDDALEKKAKRWQKIVQSATQQSGRGDLMPVSPPQTLRQLLEEINPEEGLAGLFPYEGECQLTVRDAISQVRRSHPEKTLRQVWLFVGSEGGFSEEEVQQFQGFGMQPATLGEQVLRVDTACLALVAILKYEFHLWEGS